MASITPFLDFGAIQRGRESRIRFNDAQDLAAANKRIRDQAWEDEQIKRQADIYMSTLSNNRALAEQNGVAPAEYYRNQREMMEADPNFLNMPAMGQKLARDALYSQGIQSLAHLEKAGRTEDFNALAPVLGLGTGINKELTAYQQGLALDKLVEEGKAKDLGDGRYEIDGIVVTRPQYYASVPKASSFGGALTALGKLQSDAAQAKEISDIGSAAQTKAAAMNMAQLLIAAGKQNEALQLLGNAYPEYADYLSSLANGDVQSQPSVAQPQPTDVRPPLLMPQPTDAQPPSYVPDLKDIIGTATTTQVNPEPVKSWTDLLREEQQRAEQLTRQRDALVEVFNDLRTYQMSKVSNQDDLEALRYKAGRVQEAIGDLQKQINEAKAGISKYDNALKVQDKDRKLNEYERDIQRLIEDVLSGVK